MILTVLHARMQTCDMNTPRTPIPFGAEPRLRGELKEPLQLRLPASIKRQFKAQAALRGCEPNQLFVEVWKHYQKTVASIGDRS